MDNPNFHLENLVKTRGEMQDFSGPLSLILSLLSKNKIEISDLHISDILDQYLDFISKIQSMDLDIASEFVQMASYLVYIKTRALIEDEEDEELLELKMSLEKIKSSKTYLSIKAVTHHFLSAYQIGSMMFSKQPEPLAVYNKYKTYNYSHEPSELLQALLSLFMRVGNSNTENENNEFFVPKRIIYGVQEKCIQLMELLDFGVRKPLDELYELSQSRSEIVATFISVLELCRKGSIALEIRNGELGVILINEKKRNFQT